MNKTIYTKTYKGILKRLKQARIDAGLKQEDVAAKLKCTQSYVSKAENGQLRLDVIQLKEFGDLYQKSIEFFLK